MNKVASKIKPSTKVASVTECTSTSNGIVPRVPEETPARLNYLYIYQLDDLKKAIRLDSVLNASSTLDVCAIDCKGVPESLDLIQIATKTDVYVIDCVHIDPMNVFLHLAPLMQNTEILKLFHDLHKDVVALQRFNIMPRSVLDTQLASEFLTDKPFTGMNEMLEHFGVPKHPLKDIVKRNFHQIDNDCWKKRPLPKDLIEYAALNALLLLKAFNNLRDQLGDTLKSIINASQARATHAVENEGKRSMCFDWANGYSVASAELLDHARPEDGLRNDILKLESEVGELIDLIPTDLKTKLLDNDQPSCAVTYSLSDIVLDIGRRPWCWLENERVMLSDDESGIVTKNEIDDIISKLGGFGSDNRAGLEQMLHRISGMRDRDGDVIGLTMRVGRWFRGNAAMLVDFLLGTEKNILILGEPGSGKTTIVREAVRVLADQRNVCVVDTSNEIAGDGVIPHRCIGFARRMMVPSLDLQSKVMVECVQNHTPHVMVIDEIGRPKEVDAARTLKQRGVRIIASVHGDLRSLVKNKELRGLIGGVESVTLGDAAAKEEAMRKSKHGGGGTQISKTKAQRMGEPTFDVIVEVRRSNQHEWRIVPDAAESVDAILDGRKYKAQIRSRDPFKTEVQIEFYKA